jgi:signal transduction histidine kinase/ligand-binding sensor domain-containing protein/DNA-binding response OmpR family regulator
LNKDFQKLNKRTIREEICFFSGLLKHFALLLQIVLVIFLCSCNYARAALASASHIDRISLKEGLSNSQVRCIFQDRRGFLWFGTYDGLNRYDGYDFKVYRNQPEDSSSIIHSYVNCIAQDARNNLWVGTRQGVSMLDPLTDKFSAVYAVLPGGRKIAVNSYIRDIKVDGNGTIFVASEGDGLIVFDKGSRVGHPVPLDIYAQPKWNYSVNVLLVLPGKRVYILISGLGLCEYDAVGNKFHLLNNTIRGATCIYPDNGNLWLGTTTGLYRFNIRSAAYDRFFNELNGGLKSNRITCLQAMPDSSLWVGTDGGGIQILNKSRTQVSYLTEGYSDLGLSSNAVFSLLLDRNGRKWIGTLRGGINVIDEVKDRFQNVCHDPLNANSLISNFVKSLFEDREGKLWIGTDGGGLSIWDRRSGHFSNFRHDPQIPGTLSSNFLTSMIQDSTGKVWIATYGGGINLYQPLLNRFKVYYGMDAEGKESRRTFWCFYVDHEGNLWASGLQDGLFLYDRKADQFKLYDAKLSNILSICEDRAGNLWAGNFNGLYKINIKQKKFKFYTTGKPVRSIHKSAGADIWLGTEAGLMYFETSAGKVTRQFTTMAGLSNNNVLAIEEDASKQLWLSTYNGLCRFDPQRTTFTNFYQSNGLASKEFNFNASLRLRNGQLAFGGTGGLTLFFPEQQVPLRNAPGMAFTDIRIDERPLDFYPGFFKANEHNELVSLRVPYKHASLSFRFAAIEFTAQERIRYRYILQGWDRKWVDAGHQRNVLYTRLAPGSYVLRVNCTNPEGQWTKNELTLLVLVLPPWYATVWAFIAYALLIVGVIYWYVRNKFRETKLKYEIKLASADAEYQRNLQEKEKELNERRIEFFTGVAHEFRTPLSLIINPVKDLLAKSNSGERQDLNIVYRNSRRLLSLVDQLLLFRKADAVADALHIAPMDIVLVCREVYLCFVHQAKVSEISLVFDAPGDPVIIYGDREKIEIVLFNLISNAIKYSGNGKTVRVWLNDMPKEVIIKVIDNGPGITREAGAHVFERFYRSTKTGQKAGFGIGLYLAQQFTQRHQGQLYFESVPGNGTTFNLELLKGTSHFPGVIVTDTVDLISPLLDELSDECGNAEADDIAFETKSLVSDKKTILVIDDDTELRRYIRSLLVAFYIVYEAENGQVGLTMARDKRPDMIICDLMMPELSGIEVCTEIKSDPQLSYIPMILLTASASPESRIKGLESGADDYIQKPFEKDVLMARIANLLQNRDNLQQYFYNMITLKKANITISDEYRQFLEKCIDIVERNITDENFSIKVLAAEIGMSHSNLYRKVKSLSGHTINSFIRYIRLRKAAELLIQSDMNVNEVAFQTGFNSIKYFRSQFFKLFGANPSDFLKQKRPIFKKRFNVSG